MKDPLENGITKAIGLGNVEPHNTKIQSFIDIEINKLELLSSFTGLFENDSISVIDTTNNNEGNLDSIFNNHIVTNDIAEDDKSSIAKKYEELLNARNNDNSIKRI